MFERLPVSGNLPLARQSGFRNCIHLDAVHIRCRRGSVRIFGIGPFEAAVDLSGSNGESGFNRLTLWREGDQDAIYQAVVPLTRLGWRYCYTGTEQAGDQAVFTRPGEAVHISIDISYYGKRRLRILPNWNRAETGGKCIPDDSVLRFGRDIVKAVQRPNL